jgi:proteic killer suppression protein
MIRSFKHKGLEKYFTKGTASGIQSAHSKRLRLILGRLNASATPQDMDLPGLYFTSFGASIEADGLSALVVIGE